MDAKPSTNSPSKTKASSKTWSLVVAGYSTAAVALVAFLTINGASGIPTAAIIGTVSLAAIGFMLSIAGMLRLRRGLGPIKSTARYGFAMQASGLVGLMFGVVLVVAISSLFSYLLSALFVAAAGMSAIAGAVLLRKYFNGAIASNHRIFVWLIFGTVLIFSGVGFIVGSNIAYEYWISQVANTIYVDIGATVSACGFVLAAYSFFILSKSKCKADSNTYVTLGSKTVQEWVRNLNDLVALGGNNSTNLPAKVVLQKTD